MKTERACPACEGKGIIEANFRYRCPHCKGTGKKERGALKAEIEIRYESIIRHIQILFVNFKNKYGLRPNIIYLGQEEYTTLKSYHETLTHIDCDEVTCFGMPIREVDKNNYMATGVIMEDEK